MSRAAPAGSAVLCAWRTRRLGRHSGLFRFDRRSAAAGRMEEDFFGRLVSAPRASLASQAARRFCATFEEKDWQTGEGAIKRLSQTPRHDLGRVVVF